MASPEGWASDVRSPGQHSVSQLDSPTCLYFVKNMLARCVCHNILAPCAAVALTVSWLTGSLRRLLEQHLRYVSGVCAVFQGACYDTAPPCILVSIW